MAFSLEQAAALLYTTLLQCFEALRGTTAKELKPTFGTITQRRDVRLHRRTHMDIKISSLISNPIVRAAFERAERDLDSDPSYAVPDNPPEPLLDGAAASWSRRARCGPIEHEHRRPEAEHEARGAEHHENLSGLHPDDVLCQRLRRKNHVRPRPYADAPKTTATGVAGQSPKLV